LRYIARRIAKLDFVRALREPKAVAEAFAGDAAGLRWPLLFFTVWSLIHLEGASQEEALEAAVGPL